MEFGQRVRVGVDNLAENTKQVYLNVKEKLTHHEEGATETHRLADLRDKVVAKIAHLGKVQREIGTQTEESYTPYEVVLRRDIMKNGNESIGERARLKVDEGMEKIKEAGLHIKEKVDDLTTRDEGVMRERKRDIAQRKVNEGMIQIRGIARNILDKLNDNRENEEMTGYDVETRQIKKREILRQKFNEGLEYVREMMEKAKEHGIHTKSGDQAWISNRENVMEPEVKFNDVRGRPSVQYDSPIQGYGDYYTESHNTRGSFEGIKEKLREGVETMRERIPNISCGTNSYERRESFTDRIVEGLPQNFTLEDKHLDKGEVTLEKMPGRGSWEEVDRLQDGRRIGETTENLSGGQNVLGERVGVYYNSTL